MKVIYLVLSLSVLTLSYSCNKTGDKDVKQNESAMESEDLSKEAEKITSGADLPDCCREDIVRFGKYLDNATVYMAKKSKGEN